MVHEELLLQYGILGLWTLSLMYEKYIDRKEMKVLLTKLNEVMLQIKEHLK